MATKIKKPPQTFDRSYWLNSPEKSIISDKELSVKTGKYAVEAMQAISRQSNYRNMMVKLGKINSSLLNSGVWYGHDYYTATQGSDNKSVRERHRFLLKGGFHHGYMDKKLWRQPDSKKSITGKSFLEFNWSPNNPKASVSESLVDILEGKTFCILDCATTACIAQYSALLKVCGKHRFDRCFSGGNKFTLPLRVSNYATKNPLFLFLQSKPMDKAQVGDKISFCNHPGYKFRHLVGNAGALNLFYSYIGKVTKFVGFGLDADGETENKIEGRMIASYNEEPSSKTGIVNEKTLEETRKTKEAIQNLEKVLAALEEGKSKKEAIQNAYSSKADYPKTLDLKTFREAEKTGLDRKSVQCLNPMRVKMLLEQNPLKANLKQVFENTDIRYLRSAMNGETVSIWKDLL